MDFKYNIIHTCSIINNGMELLMDNINSIALITSDAHVVYKSANDHVYPKPLIAKCVWVK